MTPIGGYFGLETTPKNNPHRSAHALQSARNALRLIIRRHKISALWTPRFTCKSVLEAIRAEGCEVRFYGLCEDFSPKLKCKKDAWVLYTNYFGLNAANVAKTAQKYPNLIVDNAQSLLSPPSKICFYSPRKFVGVGDGGLFYDENGGYETLLATLERDESTSRARFLLSRHDVGAENGYADFKDAENSLDAAPPRLMSSLTNTLLNAIDYDFVAAKRRENFAFLHAALGGKNRLALPLNAAANAVPMVYPLLASESVRDKLISQKIFVATYWRDLEGWCAADSLEVYLSRHLLALPIDQRYGKNDMARVVLALENAGFEGESGGETGAFGLSFGGGGRSNKTVAAVQTTQSCGGGAATKTPPRYQDSHRGSLSVEGKIK